MTARLQAAGVPAQSVIYPGASHSFIEAMSIAAVSNRALADASEWLKQAFGRAGARAPP
jgi:acetyl esterase/lipase